MITKGAHHISLAVAEIEPARAFYGGLLGLPEIERPDFGFPGAWYQAGPVQLHLIETPSGVDAGSPAAKLTPLANHIAFEIEDYAGVKARLEEAGHEVFGLGEQVGQLFVRDPHGNMVEFIQPGGRLGRPVPEQ
jgi:catechol 2,3-dioxygenase-like lactoylglutathione lyase family enzyme